MKVVYNGCFGGFGLSHAGLMRYAELKGIKIYPFVDRRDDKGNLWCNAGDELANQKQIERQTLGSGA